MSLAGLSEELFGQELNFVFDEQAKEQVANPLRIIQQKNILFNSIYACKAINQQSQRLLRELHDIPDPLRF